MKWKAMEMAVYIYKKNPTKIMGLVCFLYNNMNWKEMWFIYCETMLCIYIQKVYLLSDDVSFSKYLFEMHLWKEWLFCSYIRVDKKYREISSLEIHWCKKYLFRVCWDLSCLLWFLTQPLWFLFFVSYQWGHYLPSVTQFW